jgi:hypothetical protein
MGNFIGGNTHACTGPAKQNSHARVPLGDSFGYFKSDDRSGCILIAQGTMRYELVFNLQQFRYDIGHVRLLI